MECQRCDQLDKRVKQLERQIDHEYLIRLEVLRDSLDDDFCKLSISKTIASWKRIMVEKEATRNK